MSVAARLNRRITQLAVGRHLPHRTVRVRLTLLYGGLFLLSGAALMAIAYALLVNAGFVFTLQNERGIGQSRLWRARPHELPGGLPAPARRRTPPRRRWRTGAQSRSACASTASPGSPTQRPRSRHLRRHRS